AVSETFGPNDLSVYRHGDRKPRYMLPFHRRRDDLSRLFYFADVILPMLRTYRETERSQHYYAEQRREQRSYLPPDVHSTDAPADRSSAGSNSRSKRILRTACFSV